MERRRSVGRCRASGSLPPYHDAYSNPLIYTDPDGRNPILRGLNIAKRAYQAYKCGDNLASLKTWKKMGAEEIAGFVDTLRTLTDGTANADDAFAVIDLVTGFGGEAKKGAKALGVVDEAGDFRKLPPENAGPVGHISPSEVMNKTPDEIHDRAQELGLTPKGTDPRTGSGSYVDAQTGKQRIGPHDIGDTHTHVNTPEGKKSRVGPDGSRVPKDSPEAHLPIDTTNQ